jgi:hypothetical protein
MQLVKAASLFSTKKIIGFSPGADGSVIPD